MNAPTTRKLPGEVPRHGNTLLSAPDNKSTSNVSIAQSVHHGRSIGGPITRFLRFARMGRRQFMKLAHLAVELEPKLAPVVEDWDRMRPPLQNAADLDALCLAHDIDATHFIAVAGEAESRFRDNASILIAALNMPAIVQASVKRALTRNGFRDRKMLMELMGFLPAPSNGQLGRLNPAAIKAEVGGENAKPI